MDGASGSGVGSHQVLRRTVQFPRMVDTGSLFSELQERQSGAAAPPETTMAVKWACSLQSSVWEDSREMHRLLATMACEVGSHRRGAGYLA